MRMILRNGILSNLRARGRTALFTLLILTLTCSLTLGLGMWAYCARTLAAMDENYTSIALVEYLGSGYPDPNAADPDARALAEALPGDAIAALPGVELWESTDRTLATVDGYRRVVGVVPYKDYGVVVGARFSPMTRDGWGTLEEAELPESCVVETYGSADSGMLLATTYRAPGLEPLEVPWVYYAGELGYNQVDQNGEDVPVDPAAMPQPYYLMDLDTQEQELVGELPAGYDRAAEKVYYFAKEAYYYGQKKDVVYGYNGSIVQSLYTEDGKSDVMAIFEPGDSGFAPQPGERYLLHVKRVSGNTSNRTYAVVDFYEGCAEPPYLKINAYNEPDVPALTEGIFPETAEFYRLANSYVDVTASDDVAALELFHQGILSLSEGRFPEAGEAGVCVVSYDIAAGLELAVGDALDLSRFRSGEEDIFDLAPTGETRKLEIVGITNQDNDFSGRMWVSAAEGGFEEPLFGYGLGRAVLKNQTARQTAEELERLMPEGVQVTLYDQGYYAAARPLETMETTAMAVTAASACGALAVLLLFAYLFVGRQRETVAVLHSLGTPARKIRLWLLSGGGLLSGAAATLGAALGGAGLQKVIQAALSAARDLYAADLRYSEAAVGVTKELALVDTAPAWPALVSGAGVFLAAMVLCSAFIGAARRQAAPRRGRTSVRIPRGGTSLWGRGAARFAMLSAKRGGWRSAVVPAAALVLSLLLGILALGTQGWDQEIDRLYHETKIQGHAVNPSGRSYRNLQFFPREARYLWDSGLLEDMSVSIGCSYWLWEDMPQFSNTPFGWESREAWIGKQPKLIAVNGFAAAPDFYGEEAPAITWAEDLGVEDPAALFRKTYTNLDQSWNYYGDRFGMQLTYEAKELPVYPAVVSRGFLEERGIALGKEFGVTVRYAMAFGGSPRECALRLRAVGAYAQRGRNANLYVPLSMLFDPQWLTGEEDVIGGRMPTNAIRSDEDLRNNIIAARSFDTLHFTLQSAGDLDALRDYMQGYGFNQPGSLGRNRTTLLLRDQTFTETVGSLGRYVSFSKILFPVLLLVVGLLGFVISWLMVSSRRMEFAVMRGLGAGRSRVFLSFFLEQAGLCLVGSAAAGLLLALFGSGGALAAGLFLACYLLGGALSILAAGRTNLMDLLSERE